jgi:hypothetical protein
MAANAIVNLTRIPAPQAFLRIGVETGNIGRQSRLSPAMRQLLSDRPDLQQCVYALTNGYGVEYPVGVPEVLICEEDRYFQGVISMLSPGVLLRWNHFESKNLVFTTAARRAGIPVLTAESGEIPGTLKIDSSGFFGAGTVAQHKVEFRALPVTDGEFAAATSLVNRLRDTRLNRHWQAPLSADMRQRLAGLANGRPVVFFAGDFDLATGPARWNRRGHSEVSPGFDSTPDALKHLAATADRLGWNLVFKPHPLDRSFDYSILDLPANVLVVPGGDIHELIAASDVVVAITSTLSYSALIQGRPCVMLGYNTLTGQGVAGEAVFPGDVEAVVGDALARGFDSDMREAFVRHVAQLNKYYLFDDLQLRDTRYGRPPEDVAKLIRLAMEGKGSYELIFGNH